ncbi:D-arabinono-1,4-lactone oxidase [Microbispora rosea]|uniref:D-arabinono-1,4-lactone oxidase n=1 Tax=Microbispora rosea TaxID=58117 RepID=UPI0037B2618D
MIADTVVADQAPASTRNWAGTHLIADPARLARPRTLEELRTLVRSRSGPIRILGARLSCPDLLDARPVLAVDLTGLSGVTAWSPARVTAWAGTTLATLNAALGRRGQRVDASPPVIATQTIAGAIATGTHGQGLRQSTIGDAVTALWVMDGAGDIRKVTEDDPDIGGYSMHLGALGVVVKVELRTVPNQTYVCERTCVDADDLVSAFTMAAADSEFAKAWWFPADRVAHIWRLRPATAAEARLHLGGPGTATPLGARDSSINYVVDGLVRKLSTDTRTAAGGRPQFLTVERFRDFHDSVGDAHGILCKGIPVPQINCEIGIPLASMDAAHAELSRWYEEHAPRMHYPFILRATGPSRAWMSPAYDEPTLHYGTVVYLPERGPCAQDAMDALDDVQSILARHDGVPHLGKYFNPQVFGLVARPSVQRFTALRDRLSTRHWLPSDYLDSILIHSPAEGGHGGQPDQVRGRRGGGAH